MDKRPVETRPTTTLCLVLLFAAEGACRVAMDMIVSHEHRFIFIKTRKTAGTSLEIALSRFCGRGDIITAITPEDEGIRRQLGYPGPQNNRLPLRCYSAATWRRCAASRGLYRIYHHYPAGAIRKVVGRKVWDTYYKFTIERNPFDKVVSLYYWQTQNTFPRPTVPEFLQQKGASVLSNYELYSIDGVPAVDRIIRFENLESELEEVRLRLGLPQELELPRAKGGVRATESHHSMLLSPMDRLVIERACAREIALLGYTFESDDNVG